MVCEAFTMVFETKALGSETNTVASKPATIFRLPAPKLFRIRKKGRLAKTLVSGMATMACVQNTMVPISDTAVRATKKTAAVAPTMAYRVLRGLHHSYTFQREKSVDTNCFPA